MVCDFPDEAHTTTCTHPLVRTLLSDQANLAVIVMQSTQDWQGEDLAISSIGRARLTISFWDLLSDALPAVWPD